MKIRILPNIHYVHKLLLLLFVCNISYKVSRLKALSSYNKHCRYESLNFRKMCVKNSIFITLLWKQWVMTNNRSWWGCWAFSCNLSWYNFMLANIPTLILIKYVRYTFAVVVLTEYRYHFQVPKDQQSIYLRLLLIGRKSSAFMRSFNWLRQHLDGI